MKFITNLSILHIVEEDGKFRIGDTATLQNDLPILEAMGWGVFVPDWDHEIELLSKEIEKQPEERLKKGMIIFQDRINILSRGKGLPIRIKKKEQIVEEAKEKIEYELTIKI